jgi:hypothetical protein
MSRFYGKVGYAETVETVPGVWNEQITEREYSGELRRNSVRQSPSSDSTNDDLFISNTIRIVADPYAYQNFHSIKYVEFMGAKWKVTNIEVDHPGLILTLGGVYNGQ